MKSRRTSYEVEAKFVRSCGVVHTKLGRFRLVDRLPPMLLWCERVMRLCHFGSGELIASVMASYSEYKRLQIVSHGLTPVALASRNGHSDLVDVLVKQYGCSNSDAEKVKHVTCGMTCYHHSVMRVTYGMANSYVLSFSYVCISTSLLIHHYHFLVTILQTFT